VGVRPTIYADARKWQNYAALTVRERSWRTGTVIS
jgi:hypothetical protein